MAEDPESLASSEDPAPTDPSAVPTTGVAGLIAWTKEHADEGQTWASRFLEDHKDRFVFDVGERLYRRDKESAGTIVGSAIAFRLFLFFVPLVLFVVGVAGFLARWVTTQQITDTTSVSGGLAKQINAALAQSGRARWVSVFLGLIGIAVTGRSLSKVLVTTSCLTWRLPITNKASIKVIGGIVGVIAGIGLMSTVVNLVRDHLGVAVAGLSFVSVMVFYAVAWEGVTLMLPRATSDPGALLPGAAIVAVTLSGMQAVSQLYLPSKMSHASSLYGAIGTTLVTLGWFFIFGRAVVIGMVMNAVIYERFGSISSAVLSLPVVRILPRKSAWIRRFFDVDSEGKTELHADTEADDESEQPDGQASAASSDSTDGAK